MMEAANELKVTHATVLYWCKKFNISRRSWKESTYIKQNPQGDPFFISRKLSLKGKALLNAGLLLYWAEGNKGQSSVRLANLDHRMILLFLRFLREICHINEHRLFLYVRVYKKFSLESAHQYWSKYLNIPASRIFVYPHTDKRSKRTRQWSKYGIATLEFHNIKLKQWLDSSIEGLVEQLLKEQVVDKMTPRFLIRNNGIQN